MRNWYSATLALATTAAIALSSTRAQGAGYFAPDPHRGAIHARRLP